LSPNTVRPDSKESLPGSLRTLRTIGAGLHEGPWSRRRRSVKRAGREGHTNGVPHADHLACVARRPRTRAAPGPRRRRGRAGIDAGAKLGQVWVGFT
jgi:hypothetical protein